MKEILDIVMTAGMVLFMTFIIIGFYKGRYDKHQEESGESKEA